MFVDVDSSCSRVVADIRRILEVYRDPTDGATIKVMFCMPFSRVPMTRVFGLSSTHLDKTQRVESLGRGRRVSDA